MQDQVTHVGSSKHTGVLMTHLYNQSGLPHDSYQFFRLEAFGYKLIQVVLPVGPSGTTKRYIQNILRSYNISTLPLNEKGILQQHQQKQWQERDRGHHQHHQGNTSINHWKLFNIMQSSSSIFSLHHQQHLQSLINNIFSILIFQSTTSSALGPFDQQHLQHFDFSISNNIFSTLTFRSATTSSVL